MVADLHALTTGYEDTHNLSSDIHDMVLDWLAAGLDPEKSVMFIQSHVPEHSELALLFSMITPLGWLERIPTYKEQLREITGREITTHGFLGYPVLQAADILIYKAQAVPVGEDQLSHLELTQEIARRFNRLYGNVFPEPKAILGKTPKVPGLDGRKMSKSYGNSVELGDAPDVLWQKIQKMYTDPAKIKATDPGHPDGCVVFALHKIYNPHASDRQAECLAGSVGCVACKKDLLSRMDSLKEIQERRAVLAQKPGLVQEVLREGTRQARAVARQTLDDVQSAMGLRRFSI